MSAVNDILFSQAEEILLGSGHADTIIVISGACAGRSFKARMDVEMQIAFNAELGADNRESTMMRVLPDELSTVGDIKRGDFFAYVAGGRASKWKAVKRDFNPSTVTVDFTMERQLDVIRVVFNPANARSYLTNESGVAITDESGNLIFI